MRTTEMVLCAHYLKTSKFIPVCISIYILSLNILYLGLSRESEEEAEVNETKPYQHAGAAVSSAERFR